MSSPSRSFRVVAVLLTVAALTACASSGPNVHVDSIEGALPRCNTFAWNPAPTGDAASMTEQRIRSAVMQSLKAKGYTEVTEKADCRIAYQLTTHEVEKAKPRVGVGMGGGSGGVGGGIGVSLPIGKKKAQRGTFALDVIDASKNAQVWSGSLEAAFDAAEPSDAEAKAIVEEVLAKFPNH